jgi:hypothetical protein
VVVVNEPLQIGMREFVCRYNINIPMHHTDGFFFIVAAAAMEDRSDRKTSCAGNRESVLLLQVILSHFVEESRNAGF